jgi:DNA-binding NtrC family response regulator
MKPTILLIEDDDSTRFGFVRYFSRAGYQVSETATLSEATEAISACTFNAIILDITLPDGNGIDFIDTARSLDPNIPIIVITGTGDIPLAVEAMQRGADNFLTKPVDNAALAAFLRKTLEIGDLKQQLTAKKRLERPEDIFFGETPAMQEVLHLARTSAAVDSPVMITGATGTGKGMLARWIHRQSTRAAHEFVEINCSGLRGEMLSRELFGNSRGAYTSADQDRKGLLDIADRGTLFLDEIGDMEPDIQSQFLKVLEEKSYRRLGDVKLLKSNFRLICATHRDIESLVQAGSFRQDLMYRINLMYITIPPLRERMDDLQALVAYLLNDLGSSEAVISNDVMRILKNYSWPGNIRELKNVLERALMLTPRGAVLRESHFSSLGNNRQPLHGLPPRTVQEVEELHIKSVLKQMGGDIEKAARSLNISRATLYRRLKQIRETES